MVHLYILALAAVLASYWDIRFRKIPNWLSGLILVSGIALHLMGLLPGDLLSSLGHALIALLVGMLLFRFGVWGGGDAKLYCALAIWFPLSEAPMLAMAIGIFGLLLVLSYALMKWFLKRSSDLQALPYGVAIGLGACALSFVQIFQPLVLV